jgi:hypothetical protein
MAERIGISTQTYLTMGTYFFVILFTSSSMIPAGVTVAVVLLVQMLGFLLLPTIFRRMKGLVLPFSVLLFTAACAYGCQWILSIIPVSGLVGDTFPLPGVSYLLLLVPLFMEKAKDEHSFSAGTSMKLAGMFALMMLFVATVREYTGLGSIAGIRFQTLGSAPVPFLATIAGAAGMIFVITVIILSLYRKKTGLNLLLDVHPDSDPSSSQPVLVRQDEYRRVYTAFVSLFVLLFSSAGMIGLFVYLPIEDTNLAWILVASVLLQGSLTGFFSWFLGKNRRDAIPTLASPWFMLMQTWIVFLPFMASTVKYLEQKGIIFVLFAILIFDICSWLIMFGGLLLRRSLRRKLIFGHRPALLTGIPFIMLLTCLCLVILSGFGEIPQNILAQIAPLS